MSDTSSPREATDENHGGLSNARATPSDSIADEVMNLLSVDTAHDSLNRYSSGTDNGDFDYFPIRVTRSPVMHARCRHTDWEACERQRLRELQEVRRLLTTGENAVQARNRAAQMEGTMRWWAECTASWRQKWARVSDERNEIRQELRTVRTELSDLRRDVHMKALDAAESGKENIAQDGDAGPNYQQMYNELKVDFLRADSRCNELSATVETSTVKLETVEQERDAMKTKLEEVASKQLTEMDKDTMKTVIEDRREARSQIAHLLEENELLRQQLRAMTDAKSKTVEQ